MCYLHDSDPRPFNHDPALKPLSCPCSQSKLCGLILHNTDVFSLFVWGVCCGVPAVQPLRMVPGSYCRSEQEVLNGVFNTSAPYIASLKGNCGVPAVQPWPPSSNCRSEQGVFSGIFSTSVLYIASLKGNQMEQASWALLTGTEWKIHPAVFHFISCPAWWV